MPTWKKDTPTEPGDYAWKERDLAHGGMMRVRIQDGRAVDEDGRDLERAYQGCFWCGPFVVAESTEPSDVPDLRDFKWLDPECHQGCASLKWKDAAAFLKRLASEGGSIVSSGICSVAEIATARACGRFFVDENYMGYVLRPKEL